MILLAMHTERQSPQWFAVTFVIAFFVLMIVFLVDGLSKRHSFLSLAMVMLSMVVFFVIGMKAKKHRTKPNNIHRNKAIQSHYYEMVTQPSADSKSAHHRPDDVGVSTGSRLNKR